MSDLISRQAAIDGVKTLHDVAWKNWHKPTLSANVVLDMIRELPSVQPRNGKWIEHEWAEKRGEILISNYECTVCGEWVRENSDFCPNCGADMREGDAK